MKNPSVYDPSVVCDSLQNPLELPGWIPERFYVKVVNSQSELTEHGKNMARTMFCIELSKSQVPMKNH